MPTKPLEARKWWSIQETADHYGVSYWTIYRMIQNKKIRAQKLGREYRINHDHMQKLENILP